MYLPQEEKDRERWGSKKREIGKDWDSKKGKIGKDRDSKQGKIGRKREREKKNMFTSSDPHPDKITWQGNVG